MAMPSSGCLFFSSSPATLLLRPALPHLSLPTRRPPRPRQQISLHRRATRQGNPPGTNPAAASSQSSPATHETLTDELKWEEALPSCLLRESLPRHVAIIMDGNSRWARDKGLPVSAGHEAGYRSLKEIIRLSCLWGIRALTVFAFSSENWFRPKAEVDFLMTLFQGVLKENFDIFVREGIKVRIIGDSAKLPKPLQKLAKEIQDVTVNKTRFELIVAVSYSGRQDIVLACQKIAQKVKDRLLEPDEITESLFAQELETNHSRDFPYPDLLIRTSGELRLSNFLLWQSAYSELYFTKSNWPDFGEADYIEALQSFQRRQRRFGQRIS
ncbi:ditranspolycis-polyprenyl diphosphate synthase protein [Dioscorea alata]|uniref:Ditranspolycis-polyprenyl diphosphate synthase protein n=3 Tax=Dioscorea alata TaxID=55571 RepID=A0ACB7UA19_DIOAL|nr:ditranspolycis-polyprenyl diphosphate synthase protein [Dioscorea alata]KAH7657117.1 ditranspolycis-polyprenyl diphosphate synthase protein [Dioscorea alata]KAH7657118.1 ditranspolycis-polyprenyl diphosphate synthase protein [Dioscorea alata]